MKQNLVGEILGKIKISGQHFDPIETALRATVNNDKRGACKQEAATVLPNRTAAT